MFASRFKLSITLGMDRLLSAFKHVTWGDVANRTVQSLLVVLHNKLASDSLGIFQIRWRLKTNALVFKLPMKSLKLAIALRVVGTRAHVCHTAEANKRLEVFRDKLRVIVADDSRLRLWVNLLRSLNDRFDVDLFHLRADLPVNDHARVSIQDGGAKVKHSANTQVRNIDMPMLVRLIELVKTDPLLADFIAKSGQKARRRKNPVHCAGTARDDVQVKHHGGQTTVSIERTLVMESDDRPPLMLG